MSEVLSGAVLAQEQLACEIAARRLVDRHDLRVPVDIFELARSYATVEEEDWPEPGCDALVFKLASKSPAILLRRRSFRRRKRFSLAHELGHVRMGWHLAVLGCKPSSDDLDLDTSPSVTSGSALTAEQLKRQEEEATIFASHILLPDKWLRTILNSANLQAVLQGVNAADVSAWACMKRLSGMLKAGFLFTFEDSEKFRVFPSAGTSVPSSVYRGELSDAAHRAISFGKATVGGRTVDWFQFADYSNDFQHVMGDSRTSTELLRHALDVAYPRVDTDYSPSINGIVGAAFTTHRGSSASIGDFHVLLRHRCLSRYPELEDIAEFEAYLGKRAAELWKRPRTPPEAAS